ncbi:MAG: ribosome maturation factor RimP [Chitinophagales bacterium]
MSKLVTLISDLIEKSFEGTSCFLVEVKALSANKYRVFVDCDKNISIDRCSELWRHLRNELEILGIWDDKFLLEVSSPGMSNPFKTLRQYQKHLNRNISILKTDGVKIEGILKTIKEESIIVEQHTPHKNKKIKQPIIKVVEIDFNQIKSTKKKISF